MVAIMSNVKKLGTTVFQMASASAALVSQLVVPLVSVVPGGRLPKFKLIVTRGGSQTTGLPAV